jgi:hypothetical protein
MSTRVQTHIEKLIGELVEEYPHAMSVEIGPDSHHAWTVTLWDFGRLGERADEVHWHSDSLVMPSRWRLSTRTGTQMSDPHATGSRAAIESREWAQIRNALDFYASNENWGDDDWGVRSVLQPPGYGRPTVKARNALQAFRRLEGKLQDG